ncbi:unnamed protein product [Moneuplotes crassus]|uniref:Uncharacterized protein n=1 Tax=Euplotes crassus TaxID=5936 RepID=A0AAD1XXE1_EUPCR|nr:unnamed protein product [Moneuplotes crassus]
MAHNCDRCGAKFDLYMYKPYQCPVSQCTKTQCYPCWVKEAQQNQQEIAQFEETKSALEDSGYCSFHKRLLKEDELVIMYNKLDLKCVDEESVQQDIKVDVKIFTQDLNNAKDDDFKINSGSSLDESKDEFIKIIDKNVLKKSAPVKWDINGVWSPVDQKIDISRIKNGEEEQIMTICRNKVIPLPHKKGTKHKYFGQFTSNGELNVIAKHKFIGA